MRRVLLLNSLLGLLPLSGLAQQSDLVSWNWVSARFQPAGSRWALEASPNYVAYHNLTHTFLRVGLGRVTYTWPRPQLAGALVGIVPRLSPHLSLVLNTEPFLYRTSFWLQEVRSQAGLQIQPSARITLQALYWNWWADYESRRVRWQHTLLLTGTFLLNETHQPVNRPLP